jgi:hypothetical protein
MLFISALMATLVALGAFTVWWAARAANEEPNPFEDRYNSAEETYNVF